MINGATHLPQSRIKQKLSRTLNPSRARAISQIPQEKTYIGLVKEKPELSFGLPDPLVETVRTLPHEEGHFATFVGAFGSQSAGQEGFARSGRAVEKNCK